MTGIFTVRGGRFKDYKDAGKDNPSSDKAALWIAD
jgi:hypothetical protein